MKYFLQGCAGGVALVLSFAVATKIADGDLAYGILCVLWSTILASGGVIYILTKLEIIR